MANLFTSQTPSGTNNSDGAPGISVGTTVRFAVAGSVTGIRFYATTTVSGTYTVALYQVTGPDDAPAGTLLASKVMSGSPTAGTWNVVNFDTPVSVTTGVLYRAVVHSSAGRYVNTSSFFTADLVNGDITADANGEDPVGLGTLGQGVFAINAALSYPSTSFSSSCYFADVAFTASGGTTPVSSSLDLRWQVRSVASSGVDLRWTVSAIVSAALDLRWQVRSVATADLDLRWQVRNAVAAAVDFRWALLASVSASLDLRWAQKALAAAPLDLRWASAGQVVSSIDLQWAVLAPVASTLDLRWAVSVGISSPLALLWVVRQRAAAPISLLWVVDAAPLPTERIPTNIRAVLTGHLQAYPSPLRIVYRR